MAALPPDALAYIAYIADNIAAGTDRQGRPDDSLVRRRVGHCYSMFNRLKPAQRIWHLPRKCSTTAKPINMQSPRRIEFDKDRYAAIVNKLKAILGTTSNVPTPTSPASTSSGDALIAPCRPRPTRPGRRRLASTT